MKYGSLLSFIHSEAIRTIKAKIATNDVNHWLPEIIYRGQKYNTIVRYSNGDIAIGLRTITAIVDVTILEDTEMTAYIADRIGFSNLNRQ